MAMRGAETLSGLAHPWRINHHLSRSLIVHNICTYADMSCLIHGSVVCELSEILIRTSPYHRLRSIRARSRFPCIFILRIGRKRRTNLILRVNNISLRGIRQLVVSKMRNMHILLMFDTLLNSLLHVLAWAITQPAWASSLLFRDASRRKESGFGNWSAIFAWLKMLFMFIIFLARI